MAWPVRYAYARNISLPKLNSKHYFWKQFNLTARGTYTECHSDIDYVSYFPLVIEFCFSEILIHWFRSSSTGTQQNIICLWSFNYYCSSSIRAPDIHLSRNIAWTRRITSIESSFAHTLQETPHVHRYSSVGRT